MKGNRRSPALGEGLPNPNLVVVLHYLSKTSWLVLATVFGYVGFRLYALGVTAQGSAEATFFGVHFALGDAGPGLVVMVVALFCALVGAVRSRVEVGNRDFIMRITSRANELERVLNERERDTDRRDRDIETWNGGGVGIVIDRTVADAFSETDAAAIIDSSGRPILLTYTFLANGEKWARDVCRRATKVSGEASESQMKSKMFTAEAEAGGSCAVSLSLLQQNDNDSAIPASLRPICGYLVTARPDASSAGRFASWSTRFVFPAVFQISRDRSAV